MLGPVGRIMTIESEGSQPEVALKWSIILSETKLHKLLVTLIEICHFLTSNTTCECTGDYF